jgi:hypothetical protein
MIERLLHFSLYIGISGLLSSCLTINDIKPEDYLNHARELMHKQQYQKAKLYVDSVKIRFPKEYSKIREGIKVMREIHFAEQTRTLAFCDSMLRARQNQLPELQKKFKFEKNENYETIGHYVYRSQVNNKALNRTYLQTKVDERGNLVLTSYYCGNHPLGHDQIRVVAGDGTFAETLPVPADGALNYHFSDSGMHYEIVRFSRQVENGVINFILAHENQAVSIRLIGGKPYSYTIQPGDKLAMKDASSLSAVLTDITRLLDEIRLAQAKIEYIRQKQQGYPSDGITNP